MLVAGATLVGRLPWFLFALISGALVDRLDRRKVMIITDSLRAVGVGLLALGVAGGGVGILTIYLVSFALGVAETFFDTSAEAIVPSLVKTEVLPAANGRLQALEWVGGLFAGPPLGAFLFAVGASLPFFLDGASFAIAAVLIALIPGVYRSEVVTHESVGIEIKSGLKWLWGQRVVRTLVMMAGVTNMFAFGIIATFVLFAQDILGVGDVGYGFLISAIGVGGLAGALIAQRLVGAIGSGNVLRLSVGVSVVAAGVMGATSEAWVAGVLLVLWGFLITGWNVVSVSLRQVLTPDELRGRVAGAARLLAWGSQPLGALLGGVLASAFGLRWPFYVAAIAYLIMLVVTWAITSNESIEQAKAAAPA
jgi:MFS family permease